MAKTVLVLGSSGLFGAHAAQAFATAGWTVRRFRRGSDMVQAAMGADVIVNGLNPPNYHDWATLIPQITTDVIAAGLASGATVLVPGNVYVYGTEPAPWTPDTPHSATTRKGKVRARMEADYRAATTHGLRVIILRAGDYMAPGNPAAVMNSVVLKNLARGKITAMGDPKVRRAYAYLPDMARVAVELATLRDTLPAFADVPFAGNVFSIEELAASLQHETGRSFKVSRFPWIAMRAAAPFWELARELLEMRYLYSTPHWMHDGPLRALLPDFHPTRFETILRAHLPMGYGTEMSTQTGR